MSNSVTIEDSNGETFAEFIDVIGVSEVKKAFQKSIKEGSLRNWFKGSRSKGGKPGWVQVVSGKPCARQPGQKSTPKCVSSAKRASMTDAERKSAQREGKELLILIKHKSLVQQNQLMCQLILKRKRSPKQ